MPRTTKASNSPSGRDWTAFREKVDHEGACRIGGSLHAEPDAAHIIQRSRVPGEEAMHRDNCIPLCRQCHQAYDAGKLDVLPYLSLGEQAYAVWLVGMLSAYQRVTGE